MSRVVFALVLLPALTALAFAASLWIQLRSGAGGVPIGFLLMPVLGLVVLVWRLGDETDGVGIVGFAAGYVPIALVLEFLSFGLLPTD